MMTTTDNAEQKINTDDLTFNSLENEAEAIADEILADIDLGTLVQAEKVQGACAITFGHANSDVLSSEEMDLERVARFRRLIRNGQYRPDAMATARALIASGDIHKG